MKLHKHLLSNYMYKFDIPPTKWFEIHVNFSEAINDESGVKLKMLTFLSKLIKYWFLVHFSETIDLYYKEIASWHHKIK